MQIQFDPRDRNACVPVLAAIFVSHPDLQDFGRPVPATPERFESADQADASEAFGGAADPATAFAPPPASDGPTDASTAALASSAPAGTLADGTSGTGNGQAAPPTASPSSGVELDAKGLPWDGRIHAGKASAPIKVADGSWRKRRGVDDATVAAVEAELRQVMAAPGPNATPAAPTAAASPEPAPAPAPTAAPAAPPPTPANAGMVSGPDVATTAASAPPPPVAAPPVAPAPAAPPVAAAPPAAPATPPATPPAAEPLTLPVLMRKITALQTAGALDVAGTNAIAVSLGLTSVRDLVQRPDLIASFDALLPAAQ